MTRRFSQNNSDVKLLSKNHSTDKFLKLELPHLQSCCDQPCLRRNSSPVLNLGTKWRILITPSGVYNTDTFSIVWKLLLVGWLVVLGLTALWDSISVYIGPTPKEGERGEKRIDESKNVQTTPTRTYYKRSRPLPYCNPNCRTPRHWKFTQHHRTTRPTPENFCK